MITVGGRVRIPVPDLWSAVAPPPRRLSPARRDDHALRYRVALRRKLTPAQDANLRALTGTKSLRAIAADFGVSLETVRVVCHRSRRVV